MNDPHRSMIAGNLVFAAFELGKIIALMPLSLIKGLWYHMIIHLIPILAITGAFILISESPQWLLAQGNFNLFKRTFQERSETEGSSLTETRPRLLRRSFPRHGGTLLCLSKILIFTFI
jgi:hypothetical protein